MTAEPVVMNTFVHQLTDRKIKGKDKTTHNHTKNGGMPTRKDYIHPQDLILLIWF